MLYKIPSFRNEAQNLELHNCLDYLIEAPSIAFILHRGVSSIALNIQRTELTVLKLQQYKESHSKNLQISLKLEEQQVKDRCTFYFYNIRKNHLLLRLKVLIALQ